MIDSTILVPKTWRSEIGRLMFFCILCVASVILSEKFPGSIITGELISIGDTTSYLSLPLFSLLPFAALVDIIVRIYNVRYTVDTRGVQARVGILSLRQRIIRVRYEDIRSVETDQTILERMFGIGRIEIATAATGDIEIEFLGIAAPSEVREMIQNERDRRQEKKESYLQDLANSQKQSAQNY